MNGERHSRTGTPTISEADPDREPAVPRAEELVPVEREAPGRGRVQREEEVRRLVHGEQAGPRLSNGKEGGWLASLDLSSISSL